MEKQQKLEVVNREEWRGGWGGVGGSRETSVRLNIRGGTWGKKNATRASFTRELGTISGKSVQGNVLNEFVRTRREHQSG